MDEREWVFCRAETMLIGVPCKDEDRERTLPAGEVGYLPKTDAKRHARSGNVTILEDLT